MDVLVCLKQILDPEIPARDFRVGAEKKVADAGAANFVTRRVGDDRNGNGGGAALRNQRTTGSCGNGRRG